MKVYTKIISLFLLMIFLTLFTLAVFMHKGALEMQKQGDTMSRAFDSNIDENIEQELLRIAHRINYFILSLEKEIDRNMLNAAWLLYELDRASEGTLTLEELEQIREKTGMSDLYLTDMDGIFTLSTESKSIGLSLFDIWEGYRMLITGESDYIPSEIKVKYETGEIFKFTAIPRADNRGILETALNASVIEGHLQEFISCNRRMNSINIINTDLLVLTSNAITEDASAHNRGEYLLSEDLEIDGFFNGSTEIVITMHEQSARIYSPIICEGGLRYIFFADIDVSDYFVMQEAIGNSVAKFSQDSISLMLTSMAVIFVILAVFALIFSIISKKLVAKLEKARSITEERVNIMLNATPLCCELWDKNNNIIDCNEEIVNFFGVKDKQEYIDRIYDFTPEYQSDGQRSEEKVKAMLEKVFNEGRSVFDWLHLSPDGVPIPVECTLVRVKYKDDFVVAAYSRDLREQTRLIENIERSQNDLKKMLELNELQLAKLNLAVKATKLGLWDMEIIQNDPVNPNNIFTWSNEFRNMLGFTDETDFPNLLSSWSERLHPDDKDKTLNALKEHMLCGTPYDVEYQLKKKNGDYAYYHAFGETVRDENDNSIHVAGTLLDITEHKNYLLTLEKQRAEAEIANKTKSVFLGTMSHEIRTPMNAILGITEIQLQNNELEPSVREGLERIYTSGDMLLGIINDILDLSKIEAGKLELKIDSYDTASLINDVSQLNVVRIGSKPIEYKLRVDENVPATLLGDMLRVKQILNNLLSNAFKYTTKGEVSLSVISEAGVGEDEIMLIFTASDTGQGMSKEQVAKIFDDYSQFNMETNRMSEGTGLGMGITRNLIRMMKGIISIESEIGKGTVATVRIPQGKINSKVLGKETANDLNEFRISSKSYMNRVQIMRHPMPYGSVLIVDDTETNIYVAQGLLTKYKLKIDSVNSGASAIEKIKTGSEYDIIFMDYMMPEMDGIETTKAIRDMGYKKTIVALTANALIGQAEMFIKNGFDDFISKPIDIRRLNTTLNKFIRDKQPAEVIKAAESQAEPIIDALPQPSIPNPLMAELFIKDAKKAITVLNTIIGNKLPYTEEDVKDYVISTHGMKSALSNINQKDLSDFSFKLEQYGKNNNVEAIVAETPAFIDSLLALIDELTPHEQTVSENITDDCAEHLKEQLISIKTACEVYDKDTISEILKELRQTLYPSQIKEFLSEIYEKLLYSEFDEIADSIDKFIQSPPFEVLLVS
jgi:PAS domain S-box-containing protein